MRDIYYDYHILEKDEIDKVMKLRKLKKKRDNKEKYCPKCHSDNLIVRKINNKPALQCKVCKYYFLTK